MTTKNNKLLVINDLHLGDGSKADDFGDNDMNLISWIRHINPDNIILNGDIFELWQFGLHSIEEKHSVILKWIEETYKPIYIKGNHDYTLTGRSRYVITLKNGDQIYIAHGHQSDNLMKNPISRFFTWCVGKIELLFPNIDNIWAKSKVAYNKAYNYAVDILGLGYNNVILGHTHQVRLGNVISPRGYWNSGCCINGKFSGVLINIEENKIEMV